MWKWYIHTALALVAAAASQRQMLENSEVGKAYIKKLVLEAPLRKLELKILV